MKDSKYLENLKIIKNLENHKIIKESQILRNVKNIQNLDIWKIQKSRGIQYLEDS